MKEIKYELELFAGAGGGILGGMLCGHTCVGACEIEEYPRKVLLARQRDGLLPKFPVWDDICTFRSDNPECAEYFDFLRSIRGELVIKGGFPCTDISSARTNNHINGKISGLEGASSGLWFEQLRIIKEVQPASAFIENSRNLRTRGLVTVLKGLGELGYNARWCVLQSKYIGADHHRPRMWILANSNESQLKGGSLSCGVHKENTYTCGSDWRENQSNMERVAYGVDNQSHRLKAIGNGQDPRVVRLAWDILNG